MKLPLSLVLPALLLLTACGGESGRQQPVADSVAVASTGVVTDAPVVATTGTSDIPAGAAGVWVEDAARASTEGADAEAAITLCEGGRASYAVFSNQLFVFMRATRAASSTGEVFSFYFDGEDVGSGFRNAGLRSPAPGALMATGHIEGDVSILVMDWSPAADYIASVRAAVQDLGGRTIFPQKFYINATAMAGLCEERE